MSAYALNLEVTVYWVPGHSQITGNETADQMAVVAALINTVNITTIPYTDLKSHIRRHLCKKCQAHYNEPTDNHA